MTLKEMLNQNFSDPKQITLERYKSAKFAFIITAFLFFVNFYFVWASFYINIFSSTLWIIYVVMLLALIFYVYFFFKNLLIDKPSPILLTSIIIFCSIIFVLLLLPILFEWGLFWIFDLVM